MNERLNEIILWVKFKHMSTVAEYVSGVCVITTIIKAF